VCFVNRLNVIIGSVFYYIKGFYPHFITCPIRCQALKMGEHIERDRVYLLYTTPQINQLILKLYSYIPCR
jgi:hypothetical protein